MLCSRVTCLNLGYLLQYFYSMEILDYDIIFKHFRKESQADLEEERKVSSIKISRMSKLFLLNMSHIM